MAECAECAECVEDGDEEVFELNDGIAGPDTSNTAASNTTHATKRAIHENNLVEAIIDNTQAAEEGEKKERKEKEKKKKKRKEGVEEVCVVNHPTGACDAGDTSGGFLDITIDH